jgi:hypothetical protein
MYGYQESGGGMSRQDVESLYAPLRDMHRFAEARSRDPGPRLSAGSKDAAVTGLEILAGAALAGVLAGRSGSPDIGKTGLPLGITFGALGYASPHIARLFGVSSGAWGHHVQDVAIGLLAAGFTLWGLGQGQQMKDQKAIAGAVPHDGVGAAPRAFRQAPQQRFLPAPRLAPLNEAELHAIMMRARRAA